MLGRSELTNVLDVSWEGLWVGDDVGEAWASDAMLEKTVRVVSVSLAVV